MNLLEAINSLWNARDALPTLEWALPQYSHQAPQARHPKGERLAAASRPIRPHLRHGVQRDRARPGGADPRHRRHPCRRPPQALRPAKNTAYTKWPKRYKENPAKKPSISSTGSPPTPAKSPTSTTPPTTCPTSAAPKTPANPSHRRPTRDTETSRTLPERVHPSRASSERRRCVGAVSKADVAEVGL